jgi:SAM-dependent methyltransferase
VDPREFDAMLALDERHWWYRGRRRVLNAVLAGLTLPPRTHARILDAGCGSGRTLDELARYGAASGTELNPMGVEAGRSRGHEVEEAAVEAIPHADDSFDLVTCLDVIEHTDDDVAALRELRRVTRPGGRALLTVPAHPRLWSLHDEVNGHRRRYTRSSLKAAAMEGGWQVERMTGFNIVYLIPAALVRLARRESQESASSELHLTPPRLDSALELPLRAEAALIGRGYDLPPGLSLLAVVRKEDPDIRPPGDDSAPRSP